MSKNKIGRDASIIENLDTLENLDEIGIEEKNSFLNSGLQDFVNQVSIICALEAGGKIEALKAYRDIKKLWNELKDKKKSVFPSSKKAG